MRTILTMLSLSICLVGQVEAQKQNEGSGGSKNNTKQSSPSSSPPGLLGGEQSVPPVIMLSGKVLLPDGMTPPESVRVELLCDEKVREHTFSSPNGNFLIQIDNATPMAGMDASFGAAEMTSRIGYGSPTYDSTFDDISRRRMGVGPTIDLRGCELRARAPNFKSETILLESRRIEGYFEVGTLMLTPMEAPSVEVVSVNSLKAPKEAKEAFDDARRELERKEPDQAQIIEKLESAVDIYPEYSIAWELLGKARLANGDAQGARQAIQRAAEVDPEYAGAQLSLAALNFQEHRWEEAAKAAQKTTALRPDLVRAHYLHAFSSFQAGDLDSALDSAVHLRSVGMSSEYPVAHYIIGAVAWKNQDIQTAADQFQTFLLLQPETPAAPSIEQQLAKWKEQGIVANPEEVEPPESR